MLRFTLGVAVLLLIVPLAFPKSYQASRFNVTLGVEPGGNLLITETVDFHFEGGPFTYVFREVPVKESDGLDQFQGFMDGQELRIGAGEMPGLELQQKSSSVRVIWHFPPTSDAAHSFVVKYRARGAVRRENGQDLLLWKAIPPDHGYRIESGRVQVIAPSGVRLDGQPEANRKATVRTSGQEITFETGKLDKNHGLTVSVPFVEGSILSQPPTWQQETKHRNAEIADALTLAIAVAAPLLVIGVLFILRLRPKNSLPRMAGPTVVASPPDDLPPALVGAVRGSWSDWRVALATLIDLGERGFLEIEAKPKRWWTTRDFTLRRKSNPGNLNQVEQVLLRLVFGSDQAYAGEVPLRKAQRQLTRRWRQFTRALREEAQAAGFIDADRERTRRKWVVIGTTMMLLSLAATGASLAAFVPQGRVTPIVVAVAVCLAFFTLGLLVLILGVALTRLSDGALARKQGWDAFRKYLKDLAAQRTQLQPEWLTSYLPYAIVLGLGNQWAKAFKDRGMPAQLAWLVGTDQFDGSEVAALVAVLNSSGAGHSSPGGGAAGGGGGGGSSGAG